MGLAAQSMKLAALSSGKLGDRMKRDHDDDDDVVDSGCWMKFRLFGGCISSRSKVDSSLSGSSTQIGTQTSDSALSFLDCFCDVMVVYLSQSCECGRSNASFFSSLPCCCYPFSFNFNFWIWGIVFLSLPYVDRIMGK